MKRRMIMLEDEARSRINNALKRLRSNRQVGTETRAADDSDSLEYHIDNILKTGGGSWNKEVAKDYVQNLEMQIGQETDSSLQQAV